MSKETKYANHAPFILDSKSKTNCITGETHMHMFSLS